MFNNRKAARFSYRKYRKNIVSQELYNKWKETNLNDVSFKQFKDYWKLIADEYVQAILTEPDGVKLGASLGDMYIGYVPCKKKAVDYKTSLELGKKVYYENWNTNGKLGKIIYGTRGRKYMYRASQFWSFKASTPFKSLVKKALRSTPERYKNSIEKRSLN